MKNNDNFEITEQLLADWIDYAKSEYNEDMTEDAAIEEICKLHNTGCLVEYSHHCPECPKFSKNCPLNIC